MPQRNTPKGTCNKSGWQNMMETEMFHYIVVHWNKTDVPCSRHKQKNCPVGRWLSPQQQNVGVMDGRCSQMGSLGRGNKWCFPLNLGLYLLLVKLIMEIAALTCWQAHWKERASEPGTPASLHRACSCNVFITYQNFVFLITRWQKWEWGIWGRGKLRHGHTSPTFVLIHCFNWQSVCFHSI